MCTPPAACVAPGPARDHADSRPAGELSVGVGHVGCPDLVAAGDEADRGVVEGIEHGEVALAGNAERQLDPVDDELVDDEPAAGPHVRRSGCSRYTVGSLQLGQILVRGIRRSGSSASRPTRRAGSARERTPSAGAVTPLPGRLRPGLEPRTARSVRRRSALGVRCRGCRGGGSGSPAPDACGCRRSRPAGSRSGRTGRSTRRTGRAGFAARASAPSASSSVSSSCQTSACAVDRGGPVVRRVVRDVVDDAVTADRLRTRRELVEGEPHRRDCTSPRNAALRGRGKR